MRIVAIEEHFTAPEVAARIPPAAMAARGWPPAADRPARMGPMAALRDAGAARLADMDAAGITVQILSAGGPGADLLSPADGPEVARAYNDRLHAIACEHPARFGGFAHLPMSAPEAAADELERAVGDLGLQGALINGTTDGRFLDDPRFAPILARAAALDVPLYLHPNLPPEPVRRAYYGDLPGASGFLLSCPGFGWHAETAIHVLRLVISGALDRHPGLKIIVGHMGEGLPMMLGRLDEVFGDHAAGHLSRTVGETILDQVWITTSGFFTLPPFMAALLSFGADRILFSADYPHSANRDGVDFLNRLPVSPADKAKIAHGNADRLLKLHD